MTAVVFPGQGSQAKGMGEELFRRFPALTREADRILGYSIAELCLEDPDGKLKQTQYTQPALFVVNALEYLRWYQEGNEPSYLAGHSLGEYNALVASGALDFSTGLELVVRRGALMSEVHDGGLSAVVGSAANEIAGHLASGNFHEIDLANLNTYEQAVIGGPLEALGRAGAYLEERGVRVIPLQVSGPFHTRYMRKAATQFAPAVRAVSYGPLRVPVIANAVARPYTQDEVGDLLVQQIDHSVRWLESVEYMLDHGVDDVIQIGPGRVVSDMVRRIKKSYQRTQSVPAQTPTRRTT